MNHEWRKLLQRLEFDENSKFYLAEYGQNLENRNLPVIFGIYDLATWLDIDRITLSNIVTKHELFYRTFHIPKRRGGLRRISTPSPTLLQIQKSIKHQILDTIPVSEHAFGFVKTRNIVDNAIFHRNQDCLLKLDLKDFFPSITIRRVMRIFQRLGYSNECAYIFSRLCTLSNSLPQGACTSPVIANICAKRLDARLAGLAKRFDLRYSRYADDLAFSGKSISNNFVNYTTEIVESEQFFINRSKTLIMKKGYRKILTGISISGKEIRLERKYKRKLRSEIHHILVEKSRIQEYLIQQDDPLYFDRIRGKLSFWLSVEPENEYANFAVEQFREIERSLSK